MVDEKKQIEKIYIKDLLKLNIDMSNFEEIPKKKYQFNKKMTSNNNLITINRDKIFNFKTRENKTGEVPFKIMKITGDYNFNYNQLSPYLLNAKSFKNEDASKPIVIHFGKNQSFLFKTVNINDDEKGKKSLYGKLNIEDLFRRGQCLSYDRYSNIIKPVSVIIKFLKLLKTRYEKNKEIQKNKSPKLFNKKNTKMNYNYYGMRRNTRASRSTKKANEKEKSELNKERKSKGIYLERSKNKEKSKSRASSESPRKSFSKINNEIYTLNELKNYFREIKEEKEKKLEENKTDKLNEFNRREALLNNLTNKIDGYMTNQKNQYHDQLKKKVEKLLYVQEGSFNNGDNKSINEMYNMLNLSNSEALLNEGDDEEDENTISNEERKNIKLLHNNTEEDLKDPIPDILPTYQTLFINGFINKMQKNQKK